jgi:hypothetical protein
MENRSTKGDREPGARAAAAIAIVALGAGLYLACRAVDAWAAFAFAQPILASALVAAIDLALLLLAIALAPALSAAVWIPLRRLLRIGR